MSTKTVQMYDADGNEIVINGSGDAQTDIEAVNSLPFTAPRNGEVIIKCETTAGSTCYFNIWLTTNKGTSFVHTFSGDSPYTTVEYNFFAQKGDTITRTASGGVVSFEIYFR